MNIYSLATLMVVGQSMHHLLSPESLESVSVDCQMPSSLHTAVALPFVGPAACYV